jgi:hypothetical protein
VAGNTCETNLCCENIGEVRRNTGLALGQQIKQNHWIQEEVQCRSEEIRTELLVEVC